jgi:hypothetical protein
MFEQLLLKIFSSVLFIFKYLAHSFFLFYIDGIFRFLHFSLYIAIFTFPTYTVLSHFCPSDYDIVHTDLFSALVSYPNMKLRVIFFPISSILDCICLSLYLVLIIWHVWASSLIPPIFFSTQIYLKSVLYSSSLRFIYLTSLFRISRLPLIATF